MAKNNRAVKRKERKAKEPQYKKDMRRRKVQSKRGRFSIFICLGK